MKMSLVEGHKARVRPTLDTIDRLRELFDGSGDPIQLPAIAVIGNQSSGKSSVLERLSGIDLPRGDGMVTRCALVLRMRNHEGRKAAEISATGFPKETIEIEQIPFKIVAITDKLAEEGQIFMEPIHLTVMGPDVPDLSLIDLPGIVYLDETGKNRNICEDIKALYMKYIKEEGCVILCVSQASEVDAEGKRTVGVVTKIDLVSTTDSTVGERLKGQGKNAWKYKLGTVAMRNRTEEEKGMSASEVSVQEQAFFRSHPSLQALSKAEQAVMLGATALVNKLLAIQTEAVRNAIPTICKQMQALLFDKKKALDALPVACEAPSDYMEVYSIMLSSLQATIADLLEARHGRLQVHARTADTGNRVADALGAGSGEAEQQVMKRLRMQPRLQDLFDSFEESIRSKSRPLLCPDFRAKVKEEMKETRGSTLADQPNPAVFRTFVVEEAQSLLAPSIQLAHDVHAYMCELATGLIQFEFRSYPSLLKQQTQAAIQFLDQSLERALPHIEEQVRMESMEFTLNHYYSDTKAKITARLQQEEKLAADATYVRSRWDDKFAGEIMDGTVHDATGAEKYIKAGNPTVNANLKKTIDEWCPIPVSNFDRAVLETQVRLYCYRKVLHKRFIDQVCAYLRLWFPRRVMDTLTNDLRRSVLAVHDSGTGLSDSGMLALQSLMQEPHSRAEERRQLRASIQRAGEGLKELRKLGVGHAPVN